MIDYTEIGPVVSQDFALDNSMNDTQEVVIYNSPVDEKGESHLIVMTVWTKEDEVAHSFEYSIADDDDCPTVQETALDPDRLVYELPENLRADASRAVRKWDADHGYGNGAGA